MNSLVLSRKFQAGWFKIPLLGEAATAIRLGVKSWWGLAKATPSWVRCFFLTARGSRRGGAELTLYL